MLQDVKEYKKNSYNLLLRHTKMGKSLNTKQTETPQETQKQSTALWIEICPAKIHILKL